MVDRDVIQALRALLKEARGNVAVSPFHKDLLARIDAALKENDRG